MPYTKTIAVFFGGRSPEHDVSIVTGLQVIKALDSQKYATLPVYVSPGGSLYTSELLLESKFYIPSEATLSTLTPVTIGMHGGDGGLLLPCKTKLFGGQKPIAFDVAVPAFHGLYGEDGNFQGLFESAGIPYTGMRTLASSLFMDKYLTKQFFLGSGVPCLPAVEIKKPRTGLMHAASHLQELLGTTQFPLCVKPSHLGSSIGVSVVQNLEELEAVLPMAFKFDTSVIAEPFVPEATEYNVSVRSSEKGIVISAIERPKRSAELLDFRQKYQTEAPKMGGTKSPQGLLALTRDIDPDISQSLRDRLTAYSKDAFRLSNGTGAPRIDFLYSEATDELYLNEINPIPGSFAYFLWEAAGEPLLFTQLMDAMIDEAVALYAQAQIPVDPTPQEARLFPRK